MSATIGATVPGDLGGPRWMQPAPQWMQMPEHGEQDVNVLGLGHADREQLSKVLTGPKRVERPASPVENASLPEQLLRLAAGGRFVLVMLNRVVRARELFQRIKTLGASDGGPEILLLHSRFRPRERAATMARLKKATSDPGRVVISTQVLEAGVDLDADVLVTELCPWPSLVQRLGRLNRRGRRVGVVRILDLPVKEPTGGWPTTKSERDRAEADARSEAARPYAWPEIEEARRRLDRLRGDASSSALETVDRIDPYTVPVEGPVLRRHHLDDLFDTDPDLSGGHLDVSRFVRGDATDLDIAVLWRSLGNAGPENDPPPHPDELCRVPITGLSQLGSDKRGWLLALQRSRRRSGAWREIRLGDRGVRPGDTVMLDVSDGGYDDELGWVGSDQSRPSSWVATVDGHRSWVRRDGGPDDDIDERTEGWMEQPGGGSPQPHTSLDGTPSAPVGGRIAGSSTGKARTGPGGAARNGRPLARYRQGP